MKKILLGLLCTVLVMGIVGCGTTNVGNDDSNNNVETNNSYSEDDWANLAFSMNDQSYKYPYKISDFIENGFVAQNSEFSSIVNGTVKSAINKGYNYAVLKQDNILINVYFDTTSTNVLVSEADIIRLEIETTNIDNEVNFEFYELKFGASLEKIEQLFGTKNYELLSDDNSYTCRYFKKLNNNKTATLELQINKTKNKLDKLSINVY